MIAQLAQVLLRVAQTKENGRQYLTDILTSKLTATSAQGGVIISTTVNGKSATFQAMPGTTVVDFMMAAEMALGTLECGLHRVPTSTYAVMR